MYLTESHIISRNHPMWVECDRLCLLSRNLYNRSLYILRKELSENGKMISFNNMYHLIKGEDCFKGLPNDVSKATLMQLNRVFMSYFKSVKSWKKNPTKFNGCPKFPNYKDTVTGRNVCIFGKNVCRLRSGKIVFNKQIDLLLNTKSDNVVEVQIVPQRSCYIIQVCYKKEEVELLSNENYMSIDLGLNNLATCTTTNFKSIIINGKPLKSINQYYNKKLSKENKQLKINNNKYVSNKTRRLTLKRNNKVNNYLHKSSKEIVKFALENNISVIVIGKNNEWKQGINIGTKNNQNFIQIPFNKLINQIEYKAKIQGISVLQHEESYTSKCSALDLESIKKHDNYLGKRIKRGLFKDSKGKIINSDINGSLNILRKQFGEVFTLDQIQGFVANPVKININK